MLTFKMESVQIWVIKLTWKKVEYQISNIKYKLLYLVTTNLDKWKFNSSSRWTVSKNEKKWEKTGHVKNFQNSAYPKVSENLNFDVVLSVEGNTHNNSRQIAAGHKHISSDGSLLAICRINATAIHVLFNKICFPMRLHSV